MAKNITLKNFNGSTWDELNPKTIAAQVVTDSAKQFVSNTEKTTWNNKAEKTLATASVNGLMSATDKAKVDGLATVATSGNYADLTNKPSIPTVGTAGGKNTGTASGNIPIIGADGKLDVAIMPTIAITDTFVVSTEAAMLALTVQIGDIAVRTDLKKSYILKTAPATALANWQELLTPTSEVVSVAGKTGAVTLTKSDVGLANVDNTSDVNKPVSTATQTALNSKANLASPTFTGTPTAPTAAVATNTTQIANTAFVQAAVANVSSSMPKITVSATQPANPTTGDFWYEVV